MNINFKIETLLKKYKLYIDNKEPSLYEKYLKAYIINKFDKIDNKLNIAIWGAGEHTIELLDLIEIKKKNIVCIIDKNAQQYNKILNGIKVIAPENLKDYYIDLIVISAPAYQKQIVDEIVKLGYKYIDLYDILSENNLPIQPWYAWGNTKFSKNHYYNFCLGLFLARKLYYREQNESYKKKILLDIIKEYLRIRDFVYAKKYINVFIDKNYKYDTNLIKFLKELDVFLEEVKEVIRSNKNNNFLFVICDGMRYKEIKDAMNRKISLPFVGKICKKSVFYTNAIANSTHTRPCMDAMLTGKLVLDDKRYKSRKYVIELNESNLFCELIKLGYKIYNDNITRVIDDSPNIKNIRAEYDVFESCTEQMWRMLVYLAEDVKEKVFYIIHLHETHYSYLCGYHKDYICMPDHISLYLNNVKCKDAIKQYLECLEYLDKQFEFYFNILPQEMGKLITSDHGQCLGEHDTFTHTFTWHEETVKTPLIINHNNIEGYIEEKLFDKSKIGELVLGILKNNEIIDFNIDEVKIQRDYIYSKTFLNNEDLKNKIPDKFFCAYRVSREKYRKQVFYDSGCEEVYMLPDEDFNVKNINH